jgi:hypothetical protein
MMTDFAICTWDDLRKKISLEGANVELDQRISGIFNTLRDITSVSLKNILTQSL